MTAHRVLRFCFFFNDTATTEIYPLSLHDALPISNPAPCSPSTSARRGSSMPAQTCLRSEEHTSELQSLTNLVCRLLLAKKTTAPHRVVPASTRYVPRRTRRATLC